MTSQLLSRTADFEHHSAPSLSPRIRMTPIELRARRAALGLSQVDLAAVLGTSQAAVSHWEAGARSPRDPQFLEDHLTALEDTVTFLTESAKRIMLDSVRVGAGAIIVFPVYANNEDYWDTDDVARQREIPASLHRVAAAHAAYGVRQINHACVRLAVLPY